MSPKASLCGSCRAPFHRVVCPPPPSGRIVRQAAKCDHSSVGGKLGKETSRFPWYCHCLVKRSTRSVSAPVIGEDRWGSN